VYEALCKFKAVIPFQIIFDLPIEILKYKTASVIQRLLLHSKAQAVHISGNVYSLVYRIQLGPQWIF
jgi:hypothetical protein